MVRLLGQAAGPLIVVAARDQTLPDLPAGVVIAHDERPGLGPLEGLRAGLAVLPEDCPAAFVTGCDAPLLVPALVRRICELLGENDAAVPVVNGQEHPLAAVYGRGVLPKVEQLLAADRRRMRDLFGEVTTRRISADELRDADPELASFENINEPDQYLAALRLAGFAPPTCGTF
jgi:molybdopterin-guanine dinucleotide biosynthesis protein A